MRILPFLPFVLLAAACSDSGSSASPPSARLDGFVSAKAEAASVTVLDARRDARTGAELVVRGRVQDFVSGAAAFVLIDESLRACSDEGDPMEDSCTTPWDYCCVEPSKIAAACAMVEFRDEQGVIREPIAGLRGLDHLDTVIVRGVAEVDPAGNLVLAGRSFSFTPNKKR